jgi:hypothetical protein
MAKYFLQSAKMAKFYFSPIVTSIYLHKKKHHKTQLLKFREAEKKTHKSISEIPLCLNLYDKKVRSRVKE